MKQAYVNESTEMFIRAGIALDASGIRALANDLHSLAVIELDADDDTNCIPASESAYQAMTILKQRIGGLTNLKSYVDTLLVGCTF